jgi:hypothetical protein
VSRRVISGPASRRFSKGGSLGRGMAKMKRTRFGSDQMFLVISVAENECCRMEEERVWEDHRG